MTSEIPQSTMMSTQMSHPGMMPPNSYMGYPVMPSTSNGAMYNFSMDDPNMGNSGSPMMMQQQPQNSPIIGGPGPSNFMQGPMGHLQQQQFPSSMPSFHSQNPSQYSSNGQPQQQQFQNPGMPPPQQQYFSNQQQQIPTTASPSRLNTPNYPSSNASNAINNNNNTPTFPNHNGTPTYANPSNMQPNNPSTFSNNGSQIQNYLPPPQMSSDFMQGQDDRSSTTNPEHMTQNYQNNEENGYNNFIPRDTNGFQGPPGSMAPPPFQRQMSSTSSNMMAAPPLKKTNSNKTMLFNSDMLMDMINSGNLSQAEAWHASNSPQSTGSTKGQRKRKMESSPNYSNNVPSDFNVQMSDFNSPLSNNSLPDINNGISMLNGNQMPPDNYGPKREKKDDDGPLQCIERMTQQTLDRSPKLNNRADTGRKQEDKQKKMAKLELIANDLNLTQGDFSQSMVRPMGMPPGPPHPSMMMPMPGGMRPPFPPPHPGFDPHNMQGGPRPPMMFQPGHPMSIHPGMPPNFMPPSSVPHSQNAMMPPYPGMASASPKFPMMSQQPPMMSPQQGNMPYPMPLDTRGMRHPPPPQMNEMMYRQHQMMLMQQQHQNGQMPL